MFEARGVKELEASRGSEATAFLGIHGHSAQAAVFMEEFLKYVELRRYDSSSLSRRLFVEAAPFVCGKARSGGASGAAARQGTQPSSWFTAWRCSNLMSGAWHKFDLRSWKVENVLRLVLWQSTFWNL